MRHTKILATLGPASNSKKILRNLAREGVDAFRINLAHGGRGEQEARIKSIRALEETAQKPIVADTRGAKIRVGKLPEGGIELQRGEKITINTRKQEYSRGVIPVPFPLQRELRKGGIVFLADGSLVLRVLNIEGPRIETRVLRGGHLLSGKGVNAPGISIYTKETAQNIKDDILFSKKMGVDYISLSFLRNVGDVKRARALLKKSPAKLIAKIESREALDNFDAIVPVVDMVMIARGDLGLEIPMPQLPLYQKEMIEKSQAAGIPVIVATQMLASMTHSPLPTRAEVSDIANAVFDSADTLMLSEETAIGEYPVEAVAEMRKTIESAEQKSPRDLFSYKKERLSVVDAVAESAGEAARDTGAKYIIVGTQSGLSARAIAKYRPSAPLIAVTPNKFVYRQMGLVWGLRGLHTPEARGPEGLFKAALDILRKKGEVKRGDVLVYVSGLTPKETDTGNTMRVVKIKK